MHVRRVVREWSSLANAREGDDADEHDKGVETDEDAFVGDEIAVALHERERVSKREKSEAPIPALEQLRSPA